MDESSLRLNIEERPAKQSQKIIGANGMKQKTLFASLAFAAMVSASNLAQANVCVDRDTETREMTVKIYEDCASSSLEHKPHTFKVNLDESTATINITGSFQREESGSMTMDCGGAQSIEVTFPDTGLRRYKILWERAFVGVVNFLDNTGEICAIQNQKLQTADELHELEWDELKQSSFARTTNLDDLIEQVADAYPATPFGRPSVIIKLESLSPSNRKNWGMIVDVTAYSPLGANLDGQRTMFRAIRKWNGWNVEDARRRYLCSSGPNAGQWTHEAC